MTRNSETQMVSQPETTSDSLKVTVVVPAELHKQVRRLGLDADMTAQDIYVSALREYLAKQTQAA